LSGAGGAGRKPTAAKQQGAVLRPHKEFSWEEISAPDFGNPAGQAWQQAVTQVEEQLRTKLHVEVLPERMRKALDLVRADAVTLHADGSASVQSGKQTYTLAPERPCPCADAKHRTELCKHTLAVELHRRAVALFHGTDAAPVPTSSATPGAPSASPTAAAAALPSAPASQAWDVHEAPASACFKFRVGNMELLYTLRGIDDTELQQRMTATMPTLQDIMEACEERAAQRVAERTAAQDAQAPPAPASAPADLPALLQQAVQQALTATAQAAGTPPPAPPSNGTAPSGAAPDDQQTGFCSIHQVPMEQKHNDRGTFYDHWLAAEQRHCNGRRNGRR
jgi:hypothetical protein